MIVRVEGIGTVEVDGPEDIATLLELLDSSEQVEDPEDHFEKLAETLETGNQRVVEAIEKLAAKPLPVMKVEPSKSPEVKASPVKKIKAVNIQRDFRGLITSAEFEVIR